MSDACADHFVVIDNQYASHGQFLATNRLNPNEILGSMRVFMDPQYKRASYVGGCLEHGVGAVALSDEQPGRT